MSEVGFFLLTPFSLPVCRRYELGTWKPCLKVSLHKPRENTRKYPERNNKNNPHQNSQSRHLRFKKITLGKLHLDGDFITPIKSLQKQTARVTLGGSHSRSLRRGRGEDAAGGSRPSRRGVGEGGNTGSTGAVGTRRPRRGQAPRWAGLRTAPRARPKPAEGNNFEGHAQEGERPANCQPSLRGRKEDPGERQNTRRLGLDGETPLRRHLPPADLETHPEPSPAQPVCVES